MLNQKLAKKIMMMKDKMTADTLLITKGLSLIGSLMTWIAIGI